MFEAEVPKKDILSAIDKIEQKFSDESFSLKIVKTSGGYQLLTKASYKASIGSLLKQKS